MLLLKHFQYKLSVFNNEISKSPPDSTNFRASGRQTRQNRIILKVGYRLNVVRVYLE